MVDIEERVGGLSKGGDERSGDGYGEEVGKEARDRSIIRDEMPSYWFC